MSKVGK